MSDNFLNTVATITKLLNSQERDRDKLGVLARSLRWHKSFDGQDVDALLSLGKLAQCKKGPGCWEVEQAVLEILCGQAQVEHVSFLIETFRHKAKGKHSNDRRRLALHALSGVAVRASHEEALLVLGEGLAHYKKDTRGWAIGFLLDSYCSLDRALPQSVIERLFFLVENDLSADVRVEAVMALASLGLVSHKKVDEVVAAAQIVRNSVEEKGED